MTCIRWSRSTRSGTSAVLLAAALLLFTSCGGDDGDGGDAPGGGAGAGGAGASGGGAGQVGGSGSGAGSGGRGGSGAGAGASGAGASGGGGAGAGASGMDGGTAGSAGQDAGMEPVATVCKAPVAAQNPGNECPDSDPVALAAEPLASGLDIPVFVTSAPGDDTRLFVVERNGRIVILDPESGDEIADFINLQDVEPAVMTSSNINTESGLLGLAFHPDYPTDPRFFVNYMSEDLGGMTTLIVSFEVSADDPDAANPDSAQVVYDFMQPQANHNGGMLAFGPDGCLYVGAGDGGNSNDMGSGHPPEGNGQNLQTPLGKLLRFDVDDPETGAPGNLEGAGIPHIWDYGLRNPWRFSFDRSTGDLYIGDVGQDLWEEVDVAPAGVGHKNWGWKIAEGNRCFGGGSCDLDALEPAVDEFAHNAFPMDRRDDCVVGGYVYRGTAIPSLQGWYVYGDNGPGRRVRAFVWDGAARCGDNTVILGELDDADGITVDADITSFGQDNSGELYITTSSSVYRIVER